MVGESDTIFAVFQSAGPRHPDLQGASRVDGRRRRRDPRVLAGCVPVETALRAVGSENGGQFVALSGELVGFDIGARRRRRKTMTESALEELVARNAITEVLYRYCRGVDRRDWELLRSCYHPEAQDDHAI